MPNINVIKPAFHQASARVNRAFSSATRPIRNLTSANETDTVEITKKEGAEEAKPAAKPEKCWYKDTPVVKNLAAATKEGLTKFFRHGWWTDIKVSGLLFVVTLPLAFIIPGHHFVLIPAYLATARTLRGTKGFFRGLFKPDKILKKEPAPESTPET